MSESILTFGVIGDTQYCDCEDGLPFDKTSTRRYRQSLITLEKAVEYFYSNNITYNILLGDLLDGKCKKLNIENECFERISNVLNKYNQKWLIPYGNHDFYCFDRIKLHNTLPIDFSVSENKKLYYSFKPILSNSTNQCIRFIVLDPFEISTFGALTEAYKKEAEELIKLKNKNVSIPNSNWYDGLSDEDMKYVPFNGSLGNEQIIWLDNILKQAKVNKEYCFIFCHVSLYPGCVSPAGLVWNHDIVLKVIQSYNNVIACLYGHDHQGGYDIDSTGIHHLVIPAPLECDLDEVTYGFISVYDTFCTVNWIGKIPPRCRTPWPQKLLYNKEIFINN